LAGNISVKIGGAAGDGVASSGETLARTFVRSGLYVSAYNSYQSVIRGGHIYFDIRASEEKIYSAGRRFDILIALDSNTIDIHGGNASRLIYDEKKVVCPENCPSSRLPIPLSEIARKISKNPILQNTVALGACVKLVGIDFAQLEGVLKDTFKEKGEGVIAENVSAGREGYDFAEKTFSPIPHSLTFSGKKRVFLTGNAALALGAVGAGCRFYAAYPMTPASSILHTLAAHSEKCGILTKQTEDELAAINMTIGASFAGVRAMCGTSGGGFALMTEAFGLAGMIETPIVVVVSQRGGPSTGLPTKTAQGDLNMMLGAGQDDFPRAIIAPLDVEDSFYATYEAFRLAEKYQIPVIVALDFYLSEHFETLDELRFLAPEKRDFTLLDSKRYAFTENGVSPRSIPGQEGLMFIASSDEHDEEGINISDVRASLPESQRIRERIMEKRMRKLSFIASEMSPPSLSGDVDADLTLLCWGSTFGVCREAQTILADEGIKVNILAFRYLFPLVPGTGEILSRRRRILGIEQNYTGQFTQLLTSHTGIQIKECLYKYSGEPLYAGEVVTRVREMMR